MSSAKKTSSRGSFFSARQPICRRRVHIMRWPSAHQLLCVLCFIRANQTSGPASLAGNEIFTRERATCSAREKLMPSAQTRGRCAQAAKVHSFHTPIRRARLNKLISTAGREGWQKEMGKLLSLSLPHSGGKKCAGRFLAERQSSSLK
jgi:hypothetical protein